jgi:hypothetical protein
MDVTIQLLSIPFKIYAQDVGKIDLYFVNKIFMNNKKNI